MSLYLLRTLNNQLQFARIRKIYSPKLYSILSSAPGQNKIEGNRYKKICCIKEPQSRKFSSPNYTETDIITPNEAAIFLKNVLVDVHQLSGLPWWSVFIILATATRLFVSIPIAIYQHYLGAKIKLIGQEAQTLVPAVREKVMLRALEERWTNKKAEMAFLREMNKQLRELQIKNNCHPFKIVLLSLTPMPFWLLMTYTIRKMAVDASMPVSNLDSLKGSSDLTVGGLFWSENLTLPDPTFILPSIVLTGTLAAVEINSLSAKGNLGLLPKITQHLCKLFTVLIFFVSMAMPSCVSLYWATSAVLAIGQCLLLLSPRMRRYFRIPKTPDETENPYRELVLKFKEKYFIFKKS